MQLTVDGLGSKPTDWTPEAAEALSRDIAKASDMSIFFGPRSHEHGPLLVCFTLIAESHISLHLDRASGLAWVDVFTCKPLPAVIDLPALIAQRLGIAAPTVHLDPDRGRLPSPTLPLAHPELTAGIHS